MVGGPPLTSFGSAPFLVVLSLYRPLLFRRCCDKPYTDLEIISRSETSLSSTPRRLPSASGSHGQRSNRPCFSCSSLTRPINLQNSLYHLNFDFQSSLAPATFASPSSCSLSTLWLFSRKVHSSLVCKVGGLPSHSNSNGTPRSQLSSMGAVHCRRLSDLHHRGRIVRCNDAG